MSRVLGFHVVIYVGYSIYIFQVCICFSVRKQVNLFPVLGISIQEVLSFWCRWVSGFGDGFNSALAGRFLYRHDALCRGVVYVHFCTSPLPPEMIRSCCKYLPDLRSFFSVYFSRVRRFM